MFSKKIDIKSVITDGESLAQNVPEDKMDEVRAVMYGLVKRFSNNKY